MIEIFADIGREIWATLGQMAPYLLFGFLAAGVLSVCCSPEFVERHLGGRGFAPVAKATVFGIPLPLCSCGVIPVAASFRRHGASRAAITSFLLSTPQTGVDSIMVTYALLGGAMAVYRPLAALATGLLGGLLVMLMLQRNADAGGSDKDAPGEPCTESCCAITASEGAARRAMRYAFLTLPRDIGVPLLAGMAVAGGIAAVAPPGAWKPVLGGGFVSMVLMMALGIPMYVCASASVPLAAAWIHLGASPGAALAFLIAGPASNAATIATAWKMLGPGSVAIYLFTIAVSAVGGGMAFDWLMDLSPAMTATLTAACEHGHGAAAAGWAPSLWAILLLAVLVFSVAAKYVPGKWFPARKLKKAVMAEGSSNASEHVILSVGGMTCQHCASTVARALQRCSGVVSAQIDWTSGRADVEGEKLSLDELATAVHNAGYTVNTKAS